MNAQSEFAGKSYEEQYQLLESGQKKLLDRGIETKLFMRRAIPLTKRHYVRSKHSGLPM